MSFKKWIVKFKDVDNPIGDLASDINEDSAFPESCTLQEAISYLKNRRAISEAIEVLEIMWPVYQKLS